MVQMVFTLSTVRLRHLFWQDNPCQRKIDDIKEKKKTANEMQSEKDCVNESLNRSRMDTSEDGVSFVNYSETFSEYDSFLLSSNPWNTGDTTFWDLSKKHTEERVKRWAISIEDLVSDPIGLQEFTSFLEKEHSVENIRFWIAVKQLHETALSQVPHKVTEIYEKFVKPGAPFEINIDGKTMQTILKDLENPSTFTFDAASQYIFLDLLKKDCYPRFMRSDQFKRLLDRACGGAKKKMTDVHCRRLKQGDGFISKLAGKLGSNLTLDLPFSGGDSAKDKSSAAHSSEISLGNASTSKLAADNFSSGCGEYRILTGFAHKLYELSAAPIKLTTTSHSLGIREKGNPLTDRLSTTMEMEKNAVCPWDLPNEPTSTDFAGSSQGRIMVSSGEQANELFTPKRMTSE